MDPRWPIVTGEVSRTRRRGLRKEPEGGWPLDHVLVGVGTLRAVREIYRQGWDGYPVRPWDVSLWCGVTPQGAINAMRRLHAIGLVEECPSETWWGGTRYRLVLEHPMYECLRDLFAGEREVERAYRRLRRSREETAPSG